ncbi:MAG: TolC family protein [Pseudomonadota bacterium]
MRRLNRLIALCVLFAFSGCTVGPDYERPDTVLPDAFGSAPEVAPELTTEVWEAFEAPELALLIERARAYNTDIAIAAATLDESRALAGLQVFSLFPTVTAQTEQERVRQSLEDPFRFPGQRVTQIYRAGFDASWEIDLFGSLRRQSESIRRRVEADTFALYAVELTVVAETAQAYFQWQGQSIRVGLLKQNLTAQKASVEILEKALAAGRGTALDVASARAQERQLAATLPAAIASTTAALQRLAVLTGQLPSDLESQLTPPETFPELPRYIAAGAPAEWLARRPDVASAERRLAEINALIGFRKADLYPKLTLIGSFGWTGRSSSIVGDTAGERWGTAPTLSWRFLDFGRVLREVKEAEAQTAGALANYEGTWRRALEETENALANYRATGETVLALREAVDQAKVAVDLSTLRYQNGADSFFVVLDAERAYLDLQDRYALAEIDQATALAALYKALGGDFAQIR